MWVSQDREIVGAKKSKRIYELHGILVNKTPKVTEVKNETKNTYYGTIKPSYRRGKKERLVKIFAYDKAGIEAIHRLKNGSIAKLAGHYKKVTDNDGKRFLVFCPVGNAKAWGVLPDRTKDLIDKGINPKLDREGNTYLHFCAESGELNDCNPLLITKENFMTKNDMEETVFSIAAGSGTFQQIPKEFMDKEAILSGRSWGDKCVHHLARNGQLQEVPTEILKELNFYECKGWHGNTPLHSATESIHIGKIPKELLDIKLLLLKNDNNKDVFSLLAEKGKLRLLPKEFQTEEIFSRKMFLKEYSGHPNTDGLTVFHEAANYDWEQIDESLINKKTLMLRNDSGYSVLSQLPDKYKTKYLSLFTNEELKKMQVRKDLGLSNEEAKGFKVKLKLKEFLSKDKDSIMI